MKTKIEVQSISFEGYGSITEKGSHKVFYCKTEACKKVLSSLMIGQKIDVEIDENDYVIEILSLGYEKEDSNSVVNLNDIPNHKESLSEFIDNEDYDNDCEFFLLSKTYMEISELSKISAKMEELGYKSMVSKVKISFTKKKK